MGRESALKDLRKQLRNVVKEQIPEVLSKELVAAAYKETVAAVSGKLQVIDMDIRAALKQMDERQKDVQSFIMRQVTQQQVALGATGQPETAQPVDATAESEVTALPAEPATE